MLGKKNTAKQRVSGKKKEDVYLYAVKEKKNGQSEKVRETEKRMLRKRSG